MSEKRRLRSQSESAENPNLFNFDNLSGILHKDQPLLVTSETSYDNLYEYDINEEETNETHQKLSSFIVKKRCIRLLEEGSGSPRQSQSQSQSHSKTQLNSQPQSNKHQRQRQRQRNNASPQILPRKSRIKLDPLVDTIFEPFHKQMNKQELVMANQDRAKVYHDIEILKEQLNQLRLYHWIRYLPSITRIKDPQNNEEMESKRQLTIKEIFRRLEKFESWKKRHESLKEDIKYFQHSLKNGYGDVDDYNAPISDLKAKRQLQHAQEYGTPFNINLNNGYVIHVDPVAPPKVVSIPNGRSSSRKSKSPLPDESNVKKKKPLHGWKSKLFGSV